MSSIEWSYDRLRLSGKFQNLSPRGSPRRDCNDEPRLRLTTWLGSHTDEARSLFENNDLTGRTATAQRSVKSMFKANPKLGRPSGPLL